MSEDIYHHAFLNRDRLVFIVDADAATCEALSIVFRLEGFQTGFSLDVVGLLAAFERRPPDVVMLNLRIGGDAGLHVMRRVRAMRTGIPVFMLADMAQVEATV